MPAAITIPDADYQRRLQGLRSGLREQAIDVALVHAPPNILYFCGFETVSIASYACLVVPHDGEATLVVWELERALAERTSAVERIVTYATGGDPLATSLAAAGSDVRRVGIEYDSPALTPRFDRQLGTSLGAELVDIGPIVAGVRRLKSKAEVDCLRAAAGYTDAGMSAAIAAARRGATDNAMAAAALQAMVAAGSEYSSMPPIVSAGAQSGVAHSTFRNIVLADGDAIVIELGGCVRRYCAPLMRTVSIGPPGRDVTELYRLAERVIERVLEIVRPGKAAADAADAAWQVMGDAPLDLVFHGVFGYAVGPGFPPSWADGTIRLRRGASETIEPGMVLHLPIAFRRPGICGVAISETVVVVDTGIEVLGRLPRELAIR